MIYLICIPWLLLVAALIWELNEHRKEVLETASLPPKERHRREMYLTYLPQSAFEAKLLDEAIERGDL